MKKMFKDYLNDKIVLDKWDKIGIISLIVVLTGVFGWIYEFIFYYFNSGCKEFYMQGGNFLPWINIYATGAILILLCCFRYKKNPILVFIIGFVISGILEFISGYVIYELFDGLRFWDYNKEILNFCNIGGFVCLRSVLFFGFSSLILIYIMVPFCIYLSKIMNKKLFLALSLGLCFIFLFDEFYNLIFARIFNLPSAYDVYTSLGFKYVK